MCAYVSVAGQPGESGFTRVLILCLPPPHFPPVLLTRVEAEQMNEQKPVPRPPPPPHLKSASTSGLNDCSSGVGEGSWLWCFGSNALRSSPGGRGTMRPSPLAAVTPAAHLHLSHLLKAHSPPAGRLLRGRWGGGGGGNASHPRGQFQNQCIANPTASQLHV